MKIINMKSGNENSATCSNAEQVSSMADSQLNENEKKSKYEAPLVFLRETEIFGKRKPSRGEWLSHVELYKAIGERIEASHMKGLQRVRGLWRIYTDNLEDKITLMLEGVPLRGKTVSVLNTNPDRFDCENSTRIRIKNIPLSVDDGIIVRTLTLQGLEVISNYREKLRVNDKLTNCETGDRLVMVKTITLKAPLPDYMLFGKFGGRVLHFGQNKTENRPKKCSKCLQDGHMFKECPNDWVCTKCNVSGHKKAECISSDPEDSEESDTESDDSTKVLSEAENQTFSTQRPAEKPVFTTGDHDTKISGTDSGIFRLDVQQSIDKYLTPNKGKQMNVTTRSPPTPAEELREKEFSEKGSKRQKKQRHKNNK